MSALAAAPHAMVMATRSASRIRIVASECTVFWLACARCQPDGQHQYGSAQARRILTGGIALPPCWEGAPKLLFSPVAGPKGDGGYGDTVTVTGPSMPQCARSEYASA